MAVSSNPIELTQKLVNFNTINPPGNEVDCAHYLGGLLEAAGFGVSYHEFSTSRTNLVARRGEQQHPLCFTGHIDTVPLGAQRWTVDPFGGEVHGDKLYGRGSSDMKSGVAAFVVAAIAMAEAVDNGPGLVLVITAGEETGSDGAFYLTQTNEILGNAGALVVAEPTSNYPLCGHKGALWLKVATRGITAHGSMPEYGENAIYKAARAVSKLEHFDFAGIAHHPVLGACTLNVGNIKGGLNINSVPDHCVLDVDIRTVPGADHGDLQEQLSEYLAPDVSEIEIIADLPSVWTETEDPWLRDVFRITESVSGERPEPRAATYFTDASALTPYYGAPTVVLGPGEGAMAHQTDEYCHVSRIEQAVEMYTAILAKWSE